MAIRGGWSTRARRDFEELEDYRRRNDEKDRYEKRDEREETDEGEGRGREDAMRDRREERGWYDDIERQLRNPDDNTDYDGLYNQLRERYEWYEEELDRYDADYDNLMAEVDRLRRENTRYFMRAAQQRNDPYPNEDRPDKEQDEDIRDDGEPKTFDELWKKA